MKKLRLQRIKTIPEPHKYQKVKDTRIDYAAYLASFPAPVLELDDSKLRVKLDPDQFSAWVDLKGEKGEPGQDGATGQAGQKGLDGIQGKEGRRGARGLQGVPGTRGKDGKPGMRGERGPIGGKGLIGERGAKGEQGIQGKDGTQGPKGDKGDMPNHRWLGSKLQFQTPSGKWGKLVDLKGPPGPRGGGLSLLGTVVNQSAADASVEYLTRFDQVGETTAYIGQALPGTANSATTWRIKLLTTETDGDLSVEWADGTAEFTKIWDNRATYPYS